MDKLSLMLEHTMNLTSIASNNSSSTSGTSDDKTSFEDLFKKAADKIKDVVSPNSQKTDETKSETKADVKVEGSADDDKAQLELAASLVTKQPIAFVDVSADTNVNVAKDGLQIDVKADLSVLPQNLVNTNANVDVGLQIGKNGIQFNVNAQAQASVGQVQQITQEQVTDEVVDTTVQDTTEITVDTLISEDTVVDAVATEDSSQSEQTDNSMTQTDSEADLLAADETEDSDDTASTDVQLFGEVETDLYKVGEATDAQKAEAPQATVDIEAPDADEQIGDTISDAIDNGQDSVLVKLNPKSLGEMTVEITRSDDGTIGVLLKATSEKTVSILQQHANGLEMQLLSSTQSEVKVEVQSGSESQQTENQMNPDGRNGSNAQHNRRNPENRAEETKAQDFIQQLRLGLVSMEAAV